MKMLIIRQQNTIYMQNQNIKRGVLGKYQSQAWVGVKCDRTRTYPHTPNLNEGDRSHALSIQNMTLTGGYCTPAKYICSQILVFFL